MMEVNKKLLFKRKDLLLLGFTFLVLLFWLVSNTVNVYKYAIVGAVFEMMWLPMILLLVVIPILSLVFWAKEKWSFKIAYLLSVLIPIAFLIYVITQG